LLYEHLNVQHEAITNQGEWLLDVELSPPDLAWLRSLPDLRPEWMLETEQPILARTGS
jgi:hypothetical protein